MARTRLCLAVLVVLAVPLDVWAQTPTLVQYVASSRDNTATIGTYAAVLPNATLSGNCLTFAVQYDNAGTASVTSVKTDLNDTLTIGPTITDATNQHTVSWYRGIATAGSKRVNLIMTGASGTEAMFLAEWYNSDCTSDTSGSSATKSQALTTTAAGDLIVQYGNVTSAVTPNLTSTAVNCTGNGGQCTLLQSNFFNGHIAQYKIGGSAGSDTMAFTTSGADTWQSVSMALKKAATGTAPSATGIRVKSINCEHYGTTTHTAQIPSSGNLLVGMWTSADTNISAISSSPSNTWSIGNAQSTSGEFGQIFYAANASTSNTMTISPTYGADVQGLDLLCLLDVSGAAAAPHDQDTSATGTTSSGTTVTVENHTPTTSNGLVLNEIVWFQSTTTLVNAPSGAQYAGAALDSGNNNLCAPQNTNASSLNEDDARGLFYNPSTATVAFQYTFQACATGVGAWVSLTSSFKAATVASGCTRTLLRAGC
jgi:hypothetical protein